MSHNTIPRILRTLAVMIGFATLAGCATTTTLIEHHSLQASTKMSSSIFLDPIANADHRVFLQVHNTTDKGGIGLTPALDAAIQAKGWRIVDDPAQAKVVLQVNVLQAGKIQQNALQAALGGGYGGVLGSGIAGAGIAALSGGGATAIGGAGLAVGAADWVGGLLVKDVTYSVITDVRVLQRGAPGQTFAVTHNTSANSGAASQSGDPRMRLLGALLGQGNAGTSTGSNVASNTGESYTEQSQYKIHQTRVVSYANQANLDWQDAEPAIRQGLVNTLSGLF